MVDSLVTELVATARDRGVPVVVDPKELSWMIASGMSWSFPG